MDAFESAVRIILQRDSSEAGEGMIFEDDRNEIDQYLQAVDEIQLSMELMSSSDDRSKVNSLIQIAIARLGNEFVNILTCSANPRYSTSSSSSAETSFCDEDYLDYDAPSEEAIDHLRRIVEMMNSVGHLPLCVQAYRKVRKALMEECFRCLDIENLSPNIAWRLETEELEAKIKRWIRVAKVCARVLFPNEQQLYEKIFHGLGIAIEDAYYMETIRDPAIQLLNFAEAMITCRRSSERLFIILELHQTMSEILPDMEVHFQSKTLEAIRIQGARILVRLSAAASEILSKFENDVLNELSPFPVPRGDIHHLSKCVMKYIIRVSIYKQTLVEVLASNPIIDSKYFLDLTFPVLKFMELGEKSPSPLALYLIRIVSSLHFKLEIKSKEYNDAALAHLFMMNNVQYIIGRIEGCPELKKMIGGDNLKQLIGIFGKAVISYQRSTLLNVLNCLSEAELNLLRSDGFTDRSHRVARKQLKSFNDLFKVVHKTQATWKVPDLQLRVELRALILQKLIPCYRRFVGRYLFNNPNIHQHVKYTPEEIENAILDFFK